MKSNQQSKPLTKRTLFVMKRDRLESRINMYFQHTRDIASVIEYLIVVMLRDALSCSDFSFLCRDLVRDLFLNAEPSALLRKYCAYFQDYFAAGSEWNQVKARLFSSQQEYDRFSKEACFYKNILNTPATRENANPDLNLRFVSVFKDAAEKKHTLTIQNANERRSGIEAIRMLKVLTTLNIFKTASGVKRFAEFVKLNRPGVKETLEEEEMYDELREESVQVSAVEETEVKTVEIIVPQDFDVTSLNEAEVLTLVRVGHPEVTSLENLQVLFVAEEPEESAEIQEPVLDPLPESPSPQLEPNDYSLVKDSSTIAVANPPEADSQKTKKPKLLTPKAAYVQSLIANRQTNTKKSSNKKNKKKGNNKKKKR